MLGRWGAALAGCAILAGCATSELAERDAGVGFGDYNAYLAERAGANVGLTPGPFISSESPGRPAGAAPAATATGVSTADLAAAGIGARSAGPAGATSAPPAGTPVATAGISPAFPSAASQSTAPEPVITRAGAVANVGGESTPGAQPLSTSYGLGSAASSSSQPQAAQPQPQTLPQPTPQWTGSAGSGTGSDTGGPDIAAYALATNNAVGQPRYTRRLASERRAARLCRRYPGADHAQRAFLEAGGPDRDRLGLDPDGDGFACTWSPEPFRAARG